MIQGDCACGGGISATGSPPLLRPTDPVSRSDQVTAGEGTVCSTGESDFSKNGSEWQHDQERGGEADLPLYRGHTGLQEGGRTAGGEVPAKPFPGSGTTCPEHRQDDQTGVRGERRKGRQEEGGLTPGPSCDQEARSGGGGERPEEEDEDNIHRKTDI